MRIHACVFVMLVTGCGGLWDGGERDAGAEDVTIDARDAVAAFDVAPESAPPPPPVDCDGGIVQPQPLTGKKWCPYQADGGTTCLEGDYCCEPADGGATCGTCDKSDFILKCSGMNNGCVGGPCCIDSQIQRRGADSCTYYEGTKPMGTTCGGSTNNVPYCSPGSAQVCSTSAECINGGTCAPLVIGADTAYPIWLGVCVASDGAVYHAP